VKRCVRVYIEGGAKGHTEDSDFRRGWKRFLAELHDTARRHGYHSLEVVRGQGRSRTYRSFLNWREVHPDDLCVLLVDAETGVPDGAAVWDVVASRVGDGWPRPEWATERHLYLIVQFVETWLLTDPAALGHFFGTGFRSEGLPCTNLEQRSKAEIERALREATKETGRGPYAHGMAHRIIGDVDPECVKALPHGARLFATLARLITGLP